MKQRIIGPTTARILGGGRDGTTLPFAHIWEPISSVRAAGVFSAAVPDAIDAQVRTAERGDNEQKEHGYNACSFSAIDGARHHDDGQRAAG